MKLGRFEKMKETKVQKQERLIKAYIKSTSSIPSYDNFIKHFKEGKSIFTSSNFSRHYWKYKGVDSTSVEGKSIIKYYKDNIKEGSLDINTSEIKEDGLYIRKFGDKEKSLVLALGKLKTTPTLNKVVKDKKSQIEVCRDYNVSFELPINKKLHIMITNDQIHFRSSDMYLKESFKSKRLFDIQ